jgi:Galactose oxidase, central domain/Kelch motif
VGSLSVTRAAHSASLLPDGRVLVAGGCTEASCEGVTATTEIIDPATGTSEASRDMIEPRVGHSAVTLQDGRILLVGGFGARDVLATTELFDPASGQFAAGPVMAEPRSGGTTVVLQDGSVLVAGGYDGSVALATAEIMDPAATEFRATGSLTQARSSNVGVVLQDGRVLVAGGDATGTTGSVLNGAELFDPATEMWTPTGSMTVRRHKHGAVTLNDGRVLIVGGSDERDGGGGIAVPSCTTLRLASSARQARWPSRATRSSMRWFGCRTARSSWRVEHPRPSCSIRGGGGSSASAATPRRMRASPSRSGSMTVRSW